MFQHVVGIVAILQIANNGNGRGDGTPSEVRKCNAVAVCAGVGAYRRLVEVLADERDVCQLDGDAERIVNLTGVQTVRPTQRKSRAKRQQVNARTTQRGGGGDQARTGRLRLLKFGVHSWAEGRGPRAEG